MAQILVRKLDDSVKDRLRVRAKAKGHSLEEEARAILTAGAGMPQPDADGERFGWATRIHARFKEIGFTDAEFAEFESSLESLRGSPVRRAEFE